MVTTGIPYTRSKKFRRPVTLRLLEVELLLLRSFSGDPEERSVRLLVTLTGPRDPTPPITRHLSFNLPYEPPGLSLRLSSTSPFGMSPPSSTDTGPSFEMETNVKQRGSDVGLHEPCFITTIVTDTVTE